MKAWQWIAVGILGALAFTAARLRWPLPGYSVGTGEGSDYGPRPSPVPGASTMHRGVDIPAPVGTPVLSPIAGTVVARFFDAAHGGGNTLVVENATWRAGFAHLSAFFVPLGASVAAGEPVAAVGNTGASTGPHLHYSLKRDGEFVDPEQVPHA